MNELTRNGWLARLSRHERLNFLLTNRIPRRWATLFVGWFSRIETPWIRDCSLAVWRAFGGDLRLHEAERTTFRSMHDCFTRRLKPGARPIDPDAGVLVSPCDALVGAHGCVAGTQVFQAKGFPYELQELLGDPALVAKYCGGSYVTLRLTSNMYHRFHAPADCRVREVVYISGDTWNVNPIALRRVERLFCKNERAVLDLELAAFGTPPGTTIALVPVAAILVASIRLNCLSHPLTLRYRGPNRIACDRAFAKGEEMGWFEHGSTIIAFAPARFALCANVVEGATLRMGEPLLRQV